MVDGRCERRRHSTKSHDRGRLYKERVTILYGLRSALTSEVENWKIAARRSLATVSDTNDDEDSLNYAVIHTTASLGIVQRAVNFLQSLQLGASSSSGFSTNIDTMMQLDVEILQRRNPKMILTKQWRPDLKWNVVTENQNNAKFPTQIFGLCCSTVKGPTVSNLIENYS